MKDRAEWDSFYEVAGESLGIGRGILCVGFCEGERREGWCWAVGECQGGGSFDARRRNESPADRHWSNLIGHTLQVGNLRVSLNRPPESRNIPLVSLPIYYSSVGSWVLI